MARQYTYKPKVGSDKPLNNFNKPPTLGASSIGNLRKNENAPSSNAINYNPKRGPTGQETKSKGGSPMGRLSSFIGRHKAASIGGAAGASVGGAMLLLGFFMSGPMSIVHAAEFIGDIAHNIKNITVISRTAANTARSVSASSRRATNMQNGRVNVASRLMARSLEKTLAKSGLTIVSDVAGEFKHFAAEAGSEVVQHLKNTGLIESGVDDAGKLIFKMDDAIKGTKKSKLFQNVIKEAVSSGKIKANWVTKSKLFSSIAGRALGTMNGVVGFHPIEKLSARIYKTTAGKAFQAFDRMIADVVIARIEKLGTKVASGLAKKILTVATTALRAGVVTFLIGVAVNFVVGLIIRRVANVDFATNLNIAQGPAAEIIAEAGHIKTGIFPSETRTPNLDILDPNIPYDEQVDNGSPMGELGLFSIKNLYREIDVFGEDGLNCPGIPPVPADDAEDSVKNEYAIAVENCIDNTAGVSYTGSSTVAVSDFWSGAAVKRALGEPVNATASFFPSVFAAEACETGLNCTGGRLDGSIPSELLVETYEGEFGKDVINALIESVFFVAPDVFEDDGTLDATGAYPTQLGSIATFGARAMSNSEMLASGGHSNEEGSPEAATIEKERLQFIADEFNEKSWFAKIFDVEDYRSAVVTLARDSGWNTTDQSLSTQLKNVAKTFAALPNLIAKGFNKISFASAKAYDSEFYGFGVVGYTQDQREALPDYDVAAEGVVRFWDVNGNGLNDFTNLKKAGVKKITKDGRVIYNEDDKARDIDIDTKDAGFTFTPLWPLDEGYNVFMCEDGGFVWEKDENGDITGETCDSGVSETRYYTVDDMVRAYLLDYPLIMAAVADDWEELRNDPTLQDVNWNEVSGYLDDYICDTGISTGYDDECNGVSTVADDPDANNPETTPQDPEAFKSTVMDILNSSKGWRNYGVEFSETSGNDGTLKISYPTTHSCATVPRFEDIVVSCHEGGTVYLPSTRWDSGSPNWNSVKGMDGVCNGACLNEYRQMVLNHEVGHFIELQDNYWTEYTKKIGDGEPDYDIPGHTNGHVLSNGDCPIMMQQTVSFFETGCAPNSWPEYTFNPPTTKKIKVVFI